MPEQVATEARETGRFEAFSDGVFAIAITLLVLELKVPDLATAGSSSAALGKALPEQWPQLRWAGDEFFHDSNHVGASPRDSAERVPHRRVAAFRERLPAVRCDVCSLPHVDPGDLSANASGKNGCLFYSGSFVFIAMCFYLFIRAAFRKPLQSATASMEFVAKTCHDYMLGPPLYLVATVSALLDERLSLAVCTALWIFWATTITKNTRA